MLTEELLSLIMELDKLTKDLPEEQVFVGNMIGQITLSEHPTQDSVSKKAKLENSTSDLITLGNNLTVNDEEIECVKNSLSLRWNSIIDKQDYTLSNSDINQKWILIAKGLAEITKEPYLKILMPTITNDKDPNDGTSLTDTNSLTNFGLCTGNTILYRKLSFINLIDNNQGNFFILTNSQQRALTIEEMSRLSKSSSHKDLIVNDENNVKQTYPNFWHLFKDRVLSGFKLKVRIPIDPLINFIRELVDEYWKLKSRSEDYGLFRTKMLQFYTLLYKKFSLLELNSLYTYNIELTKENNFINNDNPIYLIEVLITIFQAENYVIDREIALVKQVTTEINNSNIIYQHYLKLMVSFFAIDTRTFNKEKIIFWDQFNDVDGGKKSAFNSLKDFYNKPFDYRNLISFEAKFSLNFPDIMSFYHEKTDHVFFPVAVLVNVLVNGKYSLPNFALFLNDIIQTYTDNTKSNLEKEIRINIILVKMIKNRLTADVKKTLLDDLNAADVFLSESLLIANCKKHLVTRLNLLISKKPSFFVNSKVPDVNADTIPDLVKAYLNALGACSELEEPRKYLVNLNTKILNWEELNRVNQENQSTAQPINCSDP